MTLKACSSLRLAIFCTLTCSPKISLTPCAKAAAVGQQALYSSESRAAALGLLRTLAIRHFCRSHCCRMRQALRVDYNKALDAHSPSPCSSRSARPRSNTCCWRGPRQPDFLSACSKQAAIIARLTSDSEVRVQCAPFGEVTRQGTPLAACTQPIQYRAAQVVHVQQRANRLKLITDNGVSCSWHPVSRQDFGQTLGSRCHK